MKTIGIAGSQSRIGTTTQALQMILCLHKLEYGAAYIEMGSQGYLTDLKDLFPDEVQEKAKTGSIIFQDIELYRSGDIVTANKQGYDYIVKDYGAVTDPEFQKLSFLEQDIKIIVGGIKANEVVFAENILKEKCYAGVKYIFSFVPPHERQNVKRSMRKHNVSTYFASYAPDPFVYQENEVYEYLLGSCKHEV
jgi:hypothetical protein